MKASTSKLLTNILNGKGVSKRVHQETIEHAKLNDWITFDSEKGWQITDKGYLAYLRS